MIAECPDCGRAVGWDRPARLVHHADGSHTLLTTASQVERAYGHTPQHAPQRHRSTEPLMTWRRRRLRKVTHVALVWALAFGLSAGGAVAIGALGLGFAMMTFLAFAWGLLVAGAAQVYVETVVNR